MELLWFMIYVLFGVLIAEGRSNLQKNSFRLSGFFAATSTVFFWPFLLALNFIEVVDQIKRDRGI